MCHTQDLCSSGAQGLPGNEPITQASTSSNTLNDALLQEIMLLEQRLAMP